MEILQIELAAVFQVDELALVNWERGHTEPLVQHLPQIIEFFGYVPGDLFPPISLGQKIR